MTKSQKEKIDRLLAEATATNVDKMIRWLEAEAIMRQAKKQTRSSQMKLLDTI
jgi:hypothetical protein